jgi:hypothetical protein
MKKILIVFAFVVFGMFFVSSQGFSGSVNNVQYANPSVDSIYRSGLPDFWKGAGDSFDESMCDSGTDFVLMIPPAGCQPMVVRSDLLSQQNVPIMCQLSSVRVNPLIRVSSIRSIGFSGDMPEEVAGVSFYPARAATRSYDSLQGDPIYNNVGYVVITLKKNPDENSMSKFVEGNLTARISYDAERAFGVGNAVLFLEQSDGRDEVAFWGGQGVVKMLAADSEKARFGIYSQEGHLIREVVLKEGETSDKIYLPGFYCQASLRLKLSNFHVPEDSALLNIDGEEIWVRKGSKILNGRCNVREVDLYAGNSGRVLLDCMGAGRIELSLMDGYSANFSVNSKSSNFELGKNVTSGSLSDGSSLNWYLGFVGKVGDSRNLEEVVVLLGSNEEIRPEVYSEVARAVRGIEKRELGVGGDSNNIVTTLKQASSIAGFRKGVSLVVLGGNDHQEKLNIQFNGLVTDREIREGEEGVKKREIADDVSKYLTKAKNAVTKLLEEYKNVKGKISGFGETALLEQINLLEQARNIPAMMEAMDSFLTAYPDSVHANVVRRLLEQERSYDTRNARAGFEINGQYYSVSLREFSPVDLSSKSARIFNGGKSLGGAGVMREGDEANLDDVTSLKITKIYPNRVDFEIYVNKTTNGQTTKVREGGTRTARLNEDLEIKIAEKTFLIDVTDLDVDIVANVEIRADADNKRGEANFTYKVGIEQRTIQLNPNKSSEKAAKLNETIKKWEGKNEKLGSVIEAWKGACLLTGFSLNVLNMVKGYSGESLARQDVMKVWKEICDTDETPTSLGTTRSNDACYNEHATQIKQDVDAYANAVKAINEGTKGKTDIKEFLNEKYGAEQKITIDGQEMPLRNMTSWDQARSYMLYLKLKDDDSVSPELQAHLKNSMEVKLLPAAQAYNIATSAPQEEGSDEARYCKNKITSPIVTYYESGSVRGLAAMVPFDKEQGWYVRVSSSVGGPFTQESKGYTSAAVPETFTICNVGRDGMQSPADSCRTFSINHNLDMSRSHNVAGCLMKVQDLDRLLRDAQDAIRQANRRYSETGKINIQVGSRAPIQATRGTPQAEGGPIEQCQDFMSPEHCSLLFNVCDPVMCPPSRFNFGGRYNVPNVIQSGVIGSLVLGLPNFKLFGGDVYVPICLTGVHAGIDGYISVLRAQRDCLEENARTGNYVGMCDYMTKIYKCNLVWNFIGPQMSNILPSLFSLVTGKERRGQGGGEYLAFQTAWDNMESSLDYFQNRYGSASFTGLEFGNVEQFGTEVCNAFVGTSFPTSASALDRMLKPDSPYQIYAEFHEVPHTDATVPPTSQYNVLVHLYAGKDQGVSYSTYLKSPPSSGYYTSIPYLNVPRGTGFVPMGEYVQLSESFTAPAGYKELCVSVNGIERCNFGPVTTNFAIDQLAKGYVEDQAERTKITTEKECQQGTSGVVGFTSINPQAAVTNVVDPRLDLKGIVRVCSSVNPGEGTSKEALWENVGHCGDANMICWLDRTSVSDVTGQVLDVAGTIRTAERAMRDIDKTKIFDNNQSMKKVEQISKMVNAADVKDKEQEILGNISELHDKGFSIMYQAEAIYWKFKLYEKIVYNILNIESPSSEIRIRSASEPEEKEDLGLSELVLRDLKKDQRVLYDGKIYTLLLPRNLSDGRITIPLEDSSGIKHLVGNPTDKLSSKGIEII